MFKCSYRLTQTITMACFCYVIPNLDALGSFCCIFCPMHVMELCVWLGVSTFYYQPNLSLPALHFRLCYILSTTGLAKTGKCGVLCISVCAMYFLLLDSYMQLCTVLFPPLVSHISPSSSCDCIFLLWAKSTCPSSR